MEDIRERYDELDNLISTLNILIADTESKDIKEDLENFKFSYIDEKEELEEKLIKLEEKEEREANIEYEKSRI